MGLAPSAERIYRDGFVVVEKNLRLYPALDIQKIGSKGQTGKFSSCIYPTESARSRNNIVQRGLTRKRRFPRFIRDGAKIDEPEREVLD
jgi:hypothetical protein